MITEVHNTAEVEQGVYAGTPLKSPLGVSLFRGSVGKKKKKVFNL